MPAFELILLLRKMERPVLKEALKRNAGYIFEVGGILRGIENLGFRQMPFKNKAHGKIYDHANYFIFKYDSKMEDPFKIRAKCKLDLDVVRISNWLVSPTVAHLHQEKKPVECTLEEDLRPPSYRRNVQALQELAKKRTRRKHTHKNYHDTDFLIY